MEFTPYAVPHKLGIDAQPVLAGVFPAVSASTYFASSSLRPPANHVGNSLNRSPDPRITLPRPTHPDRQVESFTSHAQQLTPRPVRIGEEEGRGRIAVKAVVEERDVDIHDVGREEGAAGVSVTAACGEDVLVGDAVWC